MKSPLDTKKLQKLCESVARDARGYNEGTTAKSQDDSWARLGNESLPELQAFISEPARTSENTATTNAAGSDEAIADIERAD